MEAKNEIPADPQFDALTAANMPADLKKKIAMEYWRLKFKHPNWTVHRAMKKAGEKYNVQFDFE